MIVTDCIKKNRWVEKFWYQFINHKKVGYFITQSNSEQIFLNNRNVINDQLLQ